MAASSKDFTQYDLTSTIIPFLDRHLALPLLTHLTELDPTPYPIESLAKAQYDLVKETNLVDYAQSLFTSLSSTTEEPIDFNAKKQAVSKKNDALSAEADKVIEVISKPEVAGQLKQDKEQNLAWLKDNYKLTPDSIISLYHFGRFQYTYGSYAPASEYLYNFLVLNIDPDLNLSAHWGKLASDILSGQWEKALNEVNELRDLIDSRSGSAFSDSNVKLGERPTGDLAQLQARTWLLHWSLFVYFNHPNGLTHLLELFLSPPYLSTVRNRCPHLLRYLVFAAISARRSAAAAPTTGKRNSDPLKEVVKAIEGENYSYSDPLMDFLTRLLLEFDFEGAQECLKDTEVVVANDFFVGGGDEGKLEVFLENARYLISETYCKIHQRVDIKDLSARLNLTGEEGEKWIVNLIRDTRLEAKIDLKENMLHIHRPTQPPAQSIINATRDLAESSQTMSWALSKKVQGTSQRGGGNAGKRTGSDRKEKEESAPVASVEA